jgi:hypothetical protein
VSPDSVTFSPEDWASPHTVTVSAPVDDVVDGEDVGEVRYSIESLDNVYSALTLPRTRAVIHDASSPVQPNRQPQIASNSFVISASAVNGAFVGALTAFDPDFGQTHTWSIISGNETALISLSATTGVLLLADASQLDPIGHPEINLQVMVTDNGDPALSATGVVKLLIQTPTFDPELSLEIPETDLSYQTLGSSLAIATNAAVATFGGDGNLNGLTLVARASGKKSGKDRLTINASLGGDPAVGVAGTQILYDGTLVASILPGKPKAGLQVKFNSQATVVSVQAVVRSLAFQTTAKKRAERTLEIRLLGYEGANSSSNFVQLTMNFDA